MKTLVVILSIFLVVMVLPSLFVQAEERKDSQYTDISAHWAKEWIEEAGEKGYVSGYPDGSFQPNQVVTRAEMLTMLATALKLPFSQGGNPWYQPYVATLIDSGIHKLADFDSEYTLPLSRLELVRLAVRATDLSYQARDTVEDQDTMVLQAVEKGILHGVGEGNLDLLGNCTRAQAVVVIERILAVHRGEVLPIDETALEKLLSNEEETQ